jgi:hypothetical protein
VRKQQSSNQPLPPPSLAVPRDDAARRIGEQIEKGRAIRNQSIQTEEALAEAKSARERWHRYTAELLTRSFDNPSITTDYTRPEMSFGEPDALAARIKLFFSGMTKEIEFLVSVHDRLELIPEAPSVEVQGTKKSVERVVKANGRVFIGHGGAVVWRELKDFIHERLQLPYDEFNREIPAGRPVTQRLNDMLDGASFAFLVMTAEDEYTDATKHARGNVIHEAGLFQGRLGFEKAIILLEEGCSVTVQAGSCIRSEGTAWPLMLAVQTPTRYSQTFRCC